MIVYTHSKYPLANFHINFRNATQNIEESVLWYVVDMGVDYYLSLDINERINYKETYQIDYMYQYYTLKNHKGPAVLPPIFL